MVAWTPPPKIFREASGFHVNSAGRVTAGSGAANGIMAPIPERIGCANRYVPEARRAHTGFVSRIIGTILGAILAIWLIVTAASGIVATIKAFLIIGLIALAVVIVVWLVAGRSGRD
jgi:hypothetical protein